MKTYLIGHIKPDLDAVVSTIALAELHAKKPAYGYATSIPVITEEINNETRFVLESVGVEAPEIVTAEMLSGAQIILVDHNEDSQRSPLIDPKQVVEIVDHHKLNMNIEHPIFLTFKPWGSTASIVYWMFREEGLEIEVTTAKLLLSAIISDTVGLKSATTTDFDRKYVEELAQIAEIEDIDSWTYEIFKAKADISDLTPVQMIKNDYKIFEFGDKKVFIGQLETVQQDSVIEMKEQLLQALSEIKEQEGVDDIFLAVSDILNMNTKLLFMSGDDQMVAEKAFGGECQEDHILDIGPKLSRKKEIAPAIERAITT